jgi:hypothetical protein
MVRIQWTTEMKDRIHVLDLDMLSMYGHDDLLQSVFVVRETLVELESERIPVDLETFPMILKFGSRLNSDLAHITHPDNE